MAVTLKTSVTTDINNNLTINNITGYRSDNSTGFLKSGTDSVSTTPKEYFLDDVFLYTLLVFNKYDGTKTNVTLSMLGINVLWDIEDPSLSFTDIMNKYLVNRTIPLSQDGYYSIYQLAVPKQSIIALPRAVATNVYYSKTDGNIYTVIDTVETLVSPYTLVTNGTDFNNTNIIVSKYEYVSTFLLTSCLDSILEQFAINYTSPLCSKDNLTLSTIKDKRDLLFAVINTVDYYVEQSLYYKASKLIYDVSFCNVHKSFNC